MTSEQHAELRKGIMPCRFCGLDYLWDGNRHDPLRMAGVSTMIGASRHLNRRLTVGWYRLALSFLRLFSRRRR